MQTLHASLLICGDPPQRALHGAQTPPVSLADPDCSGTFTPDTPPSRELPELPLYSRNTCAQAAGSSSQGPQLGPWGQVPPASLTHGNGGDEGWLGFAADRPHTAPLPPMRSARTCVSVSREGGRVTHIPKPQCHVQRGRAAPGRALWAWGVPRPAPSVPPAGACTGLGGGPGAGSPACPCVKASPGRHGDSVLLPPAGQVRAGGWKWP